MFAQENRHHALQHVMALLSTKFAVQWFGWTAANIAMLGEHEARNRKYALLDALAAAYGYDLNQIDALWTNSELLISFGNRFNQASREACSTG